MVSIGSSNGLVPYGTNVDVSSMRSCEFHTGTICKNCSRHQPLILIWNIYNYSHIYYCQMSLRQVIVMHELTYQGHVMHLYPLMNYIIISSDDSRTAQFHFQPANYLSLHYGLNLMSPSYICIRPSFIIDMCRLYHCTTLCTNLP